MIINKFSSFFVYERMCGTLSKVKMKVLNKQKKKTCATTYLLFGEKYKLPWSLFDVSIKSGSDYDIASKCFRKSLRMYMCNATLAETRINVRPTKINNINNHVNNLANHHMIIH